MTKEEYKKLIQQKAKDNFFKRANDIVELFSKEMKYFHIGNQIADRINLIKGGIYTYIDDYRGTALFNYEISDDKFQYELFEFCNYLNEVAHIINGYLYEINKSVKIIIFEFYYHKNLFACICCCSYDLCSNLDFSNNIIVGENIKDKDFKNKFETLKQNIDTPPRCIICTNLDEAEKISKELIKNNKMKGK